MAKNYLLPHNFKMIGLIMLVPFLAACIWLLLVHGNTYADRHSLCL